MSYHITNPNDTAFPDQHLIGQGLTKREFFAAMALQGLLANHYIKDDIYYQGLGENLAIEAADKLIELLNKPKTNEK